MLRGWIRKAELVPEDCNSTDRPAWQLSKAVWIRVVSKAISEDGSSFTIANCACSTVQLGGNIRSATVRGSWPLAPGDKLQRIAAVTVPFATRTPIVAPKSI